MSFQSIAQVFAYVQSTPELHPHEVLTLLTLAYRKNGKTGRCCPSVATLSKTTHLPRRSQQRALQRLRTRGVIATTPDPVYRSNSYTLYVAPVAPKEPIARVAPKQDPDKEKPPRAREDVGCHPDAAPPRVWNPLEAAKKLWRYGIITPASSLWEPMTGLAGTLCLDGAAP